MSRYILSFLVGIILVVPSMVQATHIVGGNMGYNCLGGNQYEIVLDVYRDCLNGAENAPFDDPAYIGIYDAAGIIIQNVVLPFLGDDTLTTILTDPCLVILEEVCVHTTTYRKVITLPAVPGGYTLAYQRCCRNVTLDNILNPISTGATFKIELTEEAMDRCSSSPKFSNWPPVYVCTDLPLIFDHSALDVDGDSIVYSLCTPFDGGTTTNPQPNPPASPPYDTINWDIANNYGIGNMLGTGIPLSIDPHTGILTATPGTTGQFVVGVCMEEYDRATGELLSITNRDFQFNVNLCGERVSAIGSPEAQCDDYTVTFINESLNTTSFEWIFDYPFNTMTSSTSDAEFDFTYPPGNTEYTIRLIAEPGSFCADTSYTTIFLQDNSLEIDYNVDVFDCDNVAILALTDLSQDNLSPPIEWDWQVTYNGGSTSSSEQNPTFTLPLNVTGTIDFTVTSQNGCVRTASDIFVTGEGNPASFILSDIQQCIGDVVFLNPNTPLDIGYNYAWEPSNLVSDPNAINPSLTVTTTQVFTVTITPPGNECEIVRQVTVEAVPNPILDFSTHLECDGLTVTFTNLSQDASVYAWNFGDETTNTDVSNLEHPTYTYPALGTYTITLEVPSSELCPATITKEVTISQVDLDADFSYAYASCSPGSVIVQFMDESVNTSGSPITGWEWVLTPGGTSSSQNPTFTFDASQDVHVSLVVTTADGCTNTMVEDVVEVNVIDDGDQFPDTLQVCFGGSTTLDPGGDPSYSYEWSPNEGIDDNNLAAPTFSPESTTTYNVVITSFGADTCTYTEEMIVFVTPEIGLNVTGGGLTCEASATLTATSLEDVDLVWMLGGIEVGTGDTYTIDVSGVHDFTLIATDQYGCTETESQTVDISGGPVNISVPDTVSACLSDGILDLVVINLDPNDTLTYLWTPSSLFEPGTADTATPDFIEVIGEQLVSVLVTNQFGCTAMEEVVIAVIDDNITLSYDYEIDCSGATVAFTNTSSNAFGYIWDFGDGNISYDESPIYTFAMAGTYPVTLSIVFDGDCVADFTQNIIVQDPQVIADFTYAIGSCSVEQAEIVFTDQSFINIVGATIDSWEWDFSDGQNSISQNPTIFITETGDLIATLTITTSNDCIATITKTIDVQIVDLSTLQDTIIMCPGFSTPLNPGGNDTYTYEWSPNEFIDDVNSPNPTVNPEVTTLYTVVVSTIGSDTCEVTGSVLVLVPDDINVDLGDDVTTCGEGVVLHAAADVDLDVIVWTNEDGDVLGNNPEITINPYEENFIIVTVMDEYGCSDEDAINITLFPDVNLQLDGDTTLCEIATVPLTAVTAVDATVNWYIEDVLIDTGSPVMVTPVEGTNIYTAIATDNTTGCLDTSSLIVQVNTAGEVGPDSLLLVCYGQSAFLNPNGDSTLIYEWSPTTYLELNPIWNPIVTTEVEITYSVTITDPIGNCMLIRTVKVTPFSEINLQLDGDTTLCEIATVPLTGVTDVDATINWYKEGVLIDTGSPIMVTPAEGENVFTAIATDNMTGCMDTSSVIVQVNSAGAVGPDSLLMVCHGVPTPINPNGDPMLMYEWDPTTYLDLDPIWNPTVTTEVEITYMVTITDTIGHCILIESVKVVPYAEIIPIAGPDTTLCQDGPVDLNVISATLNTTFTWYDNPELMNPNIGEGSPLTVTPSGESYYYVVAEDEFGCTEMDTVLVNAFPINAGVTESYVICESTNEVTLIVTNSDPLQTLTFNWEPAEAVSPNDESVVIADLTVSEDYSVALENQYECRDTLYTTVTVINLLDSLLITATPDTILLGESSDITVDGCLFCDFEWTWPSGDITPEFGPIITATPDESYLNTYEVTTELLGCSLTDTVSVYVINGMCDTDHLFLPNAFSPNGDGANDDFWVRSSYIHLLTEFELIIYSRWGEEVFRTTDPNQKWDGTYKNELLAPDVYGYYLRTLCPEGEEFIQKGNVTLLK